MRSIKNFILAFALAGCCLLPAAHLNAQSFREATEQSKSDLQSALSELAETREQIAAEKIPLIRAVTALEEAVRQKTAELENLRRLRDNRDLGLNRLRTQVEAMEAQNEYAASLLDEFVRSFETRIDFSETQVYAGAAEAARLALEDPDMAQPLSFERQIDAIGVAVDRLESLIGGYRFAGRALTPSGEIETGTFAVFGPSVFFASEHSPLAGITYNKLNAAEAAVAVPSEHFSAGIRQLIESGEGSIPLDPTLGNALKIAEASDTLLEHLAKGGSVGVVIVGLGFICLLLGLFKVFEVTRFKTADPKKLQSVLDHIESGAMDKAQATAASIPGAGGELVQTGVEFAHESRNNLEEILYERILSARPGLERFLPFIALTAAAAPLLGLLGTVTGMIKTFNLITLFGTGDARSLSSGISEALITTALGLIVAIPALILHGVLARMARQKIGDMEQTAVGFINGITVPSTKSKSIE